MKYTSLLLMLATSLPAWAQETRSLQNFNTIDLDLPLKVKLVADNTCKVTHSSSLKGLSFNIANNVLEIELNGALPEGDPIELHFVKLENIEVNGAAKVETAEGTVLKSEKLVVECNGASKMNLKVDIDNLKMECNGASKLDMSGEADMAVIEVNGASKVQASDLKCKSLTLEADGASYFNVNATDNLTIEANGMSKGVYAGNPVNRIINVTGNASIVDANTGTSMKDERNGSDDTTRITLGKKKVIIIEDGDDIRIEKQDDNGKKDEDAPGKKYELKSVYAGFEVGMNRFTSANLDFNLPAGYDFLDCKVEKSWFYGLNLLEGDLQLVKNKLAITSGFGMEFQNMQFNTDRVLTPNVNVVQADSGLNPLSSNKLYTYNLNVPLLIKYAPRTKNSKNNFHFAVGVIGSFKAYSHIKTETAYQGFEEEYKARDDYSINPFRLTATARVGYGWFRAFVNYSLTPYFKNQAANPDIRVFAAGLTLVPFY